MNATVETVTDTPKAKRGEGLVKVHFVNDEAADHKRVPKSVKAVAINGKHYDLGAIPAEVKDQLVAYAVAQRFKTYVNNHADEAKNGADVHELADQVHSDFLSGNLYGKTSETSAKAKDEFDPSSYIDAAKRASELQHKKDPSQPVASHEQLEKLRAKIMELQGKERTGFLAKLRGHPLIGPAYMAIEANKRVAAHMNSKEKEKKEGNALADIF